MLVRWVLIAVALAGLATFVALGDGLTLEGLQRQRQAWRALCDAWPVASAGLFMLAYVLAAALSLPINVLLAVAAGALFGFVQGSVMVSFAAAAGSTLAMLASRFLFRAWVRRRLRGRIAEIEAGLSREGGRYLLALRLTPVVPYTVVNLLFGLTRFPLRQFYLISQLGMLPAVVVFVNAGTQLERLTSLSAIFSARLIVSLVLLAVVPLFAGRLLRVFQKRTFK